MRIVKHNFETLTLTRDERDSINTVMEMLKEIQDRYPNCTELESQLTGEVVRVSELARVQGVLDFFGELNQIVRATFTD